MKRQKLRRYAFLILFGMSVTKDTPEEAMDNYLESFKEDYVEADGEFNSSDLAFVSNTVCGVNENLEAIDEIISRYSKGYAVSRISRVALTALRISIYEINWCKDIPDSVSVNEAIETVKAYEDDKVRKFVNGVLGSYLAEKSE